MGQKLRRQWKKVFTYHLSPIDFVFFLLLTVVFFSLPLFLTPDSKTYIVNARVLAGDVPITSWYGVRGPLLPGILRLAFGFFGETTYGVVVAMYISYLVLIAVTLYLCHLTGILQRIGKGFTWLACTLLLFLNPQVLTYSHYVLTEFFALLLSLMAFAVILKTHQLLMRRPVPHRGWVLMVRYLSVLLCIVALYALKQMFFTLAFIPFLLSEILMLACRFSWRQITASLLAVLLLAAAIPLWSSVWSGVMKQDESAGEFDTYSAKNLANSTMIDGLRYFRPAKRGTVGEEVRIDIMNDRYDEVLESFTYTFEGTLADSIRYVFTCFSHSPARFIASYKDNYLAIINVRHVMSTDINRAYYPLTETRSFTSSTENGAWMYRYRMMEKGSNGYDDPVTGEKLPSMDPQFEQMVDNGLLSNLLFNTGYYVFSYFLYSFPAFCAPFIFLFAIVMCVVMRKKEKAAAFWQLVLLLAGSIFGYIFFLAITAGNIDRYGFPVSGWITLLVMLLVVAGLRVMWRFCQPHLQAFWAKVGKKDKSPTAQATRAAEKNVESQ